MVLLAAVAGAQGLPSKPLLKTRVEPRTFGTQDFSVTVVSGLAFSPPLSSFVHEYRLSPSLGRYCHDCTGGAQLYEYYAPLNVPEGAVIDFIGLNSTTDTDAIMGVAIFERNASGTLQFITGFSAPAHGWATDFAGPLGILVPANTGREFVLNVEQLGHGNPQFFAWVEVWWRRTVSPASTQTFNDVVPGDFGYEFIEALAASGITGGCGGGNYCPNANLTRAQMAVFLAKALGLHWPNSF
jgi:hypothetical protein